MDAILLRQFKVQLQLQCQFALLAAKDLNQALPLGDCTKIFFALQNVLTSTGNISKALWGSDRKKAQERKPLREALGITDDSPLKPRTMRNHYEHFDERLDEWNKKSQTHNSLDLGVLPRSAVRGFDQIDWFRNYDAGTKTLTFWGEDFDIQALIDEVNRLLPKIAEASRTHPTAR